MKKLSRLLLVLTLVLLIGTSVLLVACNKDGEQGSTPATPSFRVSFKKNYPDSVDDVSFANVTVRQGKTVGAYEITEDDRPAGYDFVGWFVEKDGDERFDFQTKITKNVNVYAHWTPNGKSTDVSLGGNVFTPEKVSIKTKDGDKDVENGIWRYVTGSANNEIQHEYSRFDFGTDVLNKLSAANPKTAYSVWKDEECSLTINDDKDNLVVNLKNGDNFYYVKAVAEDSKVTAVYKINVYLEPKFDVSVIRIQGNYGSTITIYDVAKGQKATAPSVGTYVGHTFEGWYYFSEEQRNEKGQIVDANGDILVKVGNKYYFADENGNRRFAYVDENGKKVVFYQGKYYLTDKSGARTATEATEIFNRLENGLPVYDEGTAIKVGSKTEYVWNFDTNVVDREDITIFGKWTTNQYSVTLKISDKDKAAGAKFANTTASELLIENVNYNSTAKVLAQLILAKIGGENPEKEFAKFAGWYYLDAVSGEEIEVIDENGNGVRAFDFAKNIELIAKFNANTYNIVVNANDDSMMQEVTGGNEAWPYDQKATFTATPKAGYKLVGWLLNGEAYDVFGTRTSVEYNVNEKDVVNGKITFTAVFAPKDINVTLVSDVDDYNRTFEVKFNSDVVIGQNAIPDVPKLSRDETKRFIGWYYLDSEGTKVYVVKYDYESNENKIVTEKWTFTEDVTLTAEWSPYEFHITIYKAKPAILPYMGDIVASTDQGWATWDAVTGTLEGYELEGYKRAFENNAVFNVTANVSDNAIYTFKYWKRLTADGKLEDVSEDELTNNQLNVTVQEQDVTYVAFWSYKQVRVTFDRGDAPESISVPAQMLVDFDTLLELPVTEGTYDEKTFAGWWNGDVQYTGADGKSVENRRFGNVELIQDGITLTAKWNNVEYFIINNGVITGIDADKAKKGDSYKSEFTINFDDEVYAIASGAFRNNKFIKKITIKGNIKNIGEEAFANSNIEQVVFEGNFKGLIIGAGAFRDCVGITEITLPDNVEQLDDGVFEGCYSLKKLAYSADVALGRLFTTRNPANDNYWYAAEQDGVRYYLPKKLTEIVVTNTVWAIADNAFENATYITNVTLATKNGDKPYTTEIGNFAFMNTGLRAGSDVATITVNLGLVEKIGNFAFKNSSIATVDFASLRKLGVDAFNGSGVTTVDFSVAPIDNVSARAFANCTALVRVDLGGIKTISMSAFANSNIQVVSNGDSVETIATMAFYKTGINSAGIFQNVEDIGENAFHDTDFFNNASGLVVIGKVLYYDKSEGNSYSVDTRIVSIAPYAFKDSKHVTLDLRGFSNLKYIESFAFAFNANVKEVMLPSSLFEIKDSAFKGSAIEKVDLSASTNIARIWQYAFADCVKLNSIVFATFTSTDDMAVKLAINDYAFSGCTALKSLDMPENLGTLDSYAFKGCTALETVNFVANAKFNPPETEEGEEPAVAYDAAGLVTIIGDGAFMDCTSLTTVTLPYFITRIGNSAFENCAALTAFTTMEDAGTKLSALRTIGDRAFFGCVKLNNVDSATTQNVGVGTNGGVGKSAFENCEELPTINLPAVSVFEEGVFRNAKSLRSVVMGASISIYVGNEAFRNCVALTDITARIATVDDGAFRNCVSLRSITFATSGVEYIGNNAFNGCVLIQKVSIPATVAAIGDSAFDGCRGITSLTFESNETLVSIGYSAFGGCALLTKVKLPSSLVALNASAFYGCSDLAYVEIGDQIAVIGEDAFALCADGVEVRFAGTTVPKFGGDIFTATENAKISVKQGYENTFKAVLGDKYTIVSYNA